METEIIDLFEEDPEPYADCEIDLFDEEDKFKPNRAYIDQAIDEYLKRGGQIEKVEPGPEFFDGMLDFFYDDEIDSFLMGSY